MSTLFNYELLEPELPHVDIQSMFIISMLAEPVLLVIVSISCPNNLLAMGLSDNPKSSSASKIL